MTGAEVYWVGCLLWQVAHSSFLFHFTFLFVYVLLSVYAAQKGTELWF
jgi:hypothetical protein